MLEYDSAVTAKLYILKAKMESLYRSAHGLVLSDEVTSASGVGSFPKPHVFRKPCWAEVRMRLSLVVTRLTEARKINCKQPIGENAAFESM
jgi:hypothetical protein